MYLVVKDELARKILKARSGCLRVCCLGWLNLEGTVTQPSPQSAQQWARAALSDLARRVRDAGAEVAHVKLRLATTGGSVRAHLTGAGQAPFVVASGSVVGPAALTLNARVATDPESLRAWLGAAGRACPIARSTRASPPTCRTRRWT